MAVAPVCTRTLAGWDKMLRAAELKLNVTTRLVIEPNEFVMMTW
jgi:hypothetical protein